MLHFDLFIIFSGSMPIPRSLDGFDVMAAVERMLDQPTLWWQALGLFVAHFSDWEQGWQACIGDDVLERKRVHAVRSAAANVGAVRLAESASALEAWLLARQAGMAGGDADALRRQLLVDFRQSWQAAAEAWETNGSGAQHE